MSHIARVSLLLVSGFLFSFASATLALQDPLPPEHPAPPSIDDVMKNMSATAVRKFPEK